MYIYIYGDIPTPLLVGLAESITPRNSETDVRRQNRATSRFRIPPHRFWVVASLGLGFKAIFGFLALRVERFKGVRV